jgi:hypothetical protein
MSSKHRHGLPKKRPDPSAKADIAADLPELEPLLDELPTLEPLEEVADDGPVRVDSKELEPGFHVTLTVSVPAMDKAAVNDAVTAPLRRALAENDVRHQRVLVRFTGDAIIGSATKSHVAEMLKEQQPLLAVVRRGYGDETVHEGKLPTVDVATRTEEGVVHVEIDTGATESQDLSMALARHLPAIASSARGKRFEFAFHGAAADDEVLDQIGGVLREAGALRVAVGGAVLFDRELTDRVKVETAGPKASIHIDPAADEATTLEAIGMVLPQHADQFGGKVVGLHGKKPLSAAVVDACVDACRRASAEQVVVHWQGTKEIVWPPLLTCVAGSEIVLRVQAGDRSRAALLAAFRREAPMHAEATNGQDVVVDWPSGFQIDAEIEALCRDELGSVLQPKTLACTIAGERREPMLPDPAGLAVDGDQFTLRLDTEAGKPLELQRAVDRRLSSLAGKLRGKSVRVQVTGSAPMSRTLLRSLCSSIEAAGAMRLDVEDHGTIDVLLPPMLTITRSGDEVHLAAVTSGRDETQQAQALQRELDAAALPAGATVVVSRSAAADAIAAVAVARGAANVVIDGPEPLRVHPPLFGAPEKNGLSRRLPVNPSADDTMVARQVERELPGLLAGLGSVMTATITVAWAGAEPTSPAVVRLVQGLVAKKAAKVLLDTGSGAPRQMHPPLPGAAPITPVPVAPPPPPVAAPAPVVPATAEPEAELAEAVAAPRVTILGHKETAQPPLLMLGVEVGTDGDQLRQVEAELRELLPSLEGRCALLVLRQGGEDVPVRSEDALVTTLRRALLGKAAATLVFRGPDARQRPYFQVADSSVQALVVGAAIADPRPRR